MMAPPSVAFMLSNVRPVGRIAQVCGGIGDERFTPWRPVREGHSHAVLTTRAGVRFAALSFDVVRKP